MGWKTGSNPWLHYESRVLTTDTQAIRQGLTASAAFHKLLSIGLVRLSAPPIKVSEQGRKEAAADREVIDARTQADAAAAHLYASHGTLVNAMNADPAAYLLMRSLRARANQLYHRKMQLIFRTEYRQAVARDAGLRPLRPEDETQDS